MIKFKETTSRYLETTRLNDIPNVKISVSDTHISEQEKLLKTMKRLNVRVPSCTLAPGTHTLEQAAKALNKMLLSFEAGNFTVMFDEELKKL